MTSPCAPRGASRGVFQRLAASSYLSPSLRTKTAPIKTRAPTSAALRDVADPDRSTYATTGSHAPVAPADFTPTRVRQLVFDGRSFILGDGRQYGVRALTPRLVLADGISAVSSEVLVRGWLQTDLRCEPAVAAWRDQVWASATASAYHPALHAGARIGLQVTANASGSTQTHGPVLHASAIDPRVGPVPPAWVRHRVERSTGWGGAISLALSYFFALVLLRWDRLWGRRRTHELIIGWDTAWLLTRSRGSILKEYIKDAWHALCGREPVHLPRLHRPSEIQDGESGSDNHSRQNLGFAAVGAPFAFGGRHANHVQEMEMSASRQGNIKEVIVTWNDVRSHRWFGVIPTGMLHNRGKTLPRQRRWSFRFDMSCPSEQQACTALTNQVHAWQKSLPRALREAEALHAAIVSLRKPASTESIDDAHQRSSETGMLLGLFPLALWRQWFPRGFGFGLMTHTFRNTSVHRRQTGHGPYQVETTWACGHRNTLGPLGERSDEVSATLANFDTVTPTRFKPAAASTLTLQARFWRSRANDQVLNETVITPIRRLFMLPIAPVAPTSFCASREVLLRSRLSGDDIRRMHRFALQHVPAHLATATTPGARRRQLAALADAFAPLTPALRLSQREMLATALLTVDPEERAVALARFVQAHGLAGMASVVRLASESSLALVRDATHRPRVASASRVESGRSPVTHTSAPTLDIVNDSDAYRRPLELVDSVSLRFATQAHPLEGRRALQQRFKAVRDALIEVEQVRQLVSTDPLIEAERRDKVRKQCEIAEASLRYLLHVPNAADRRQIRRLMQPSNARIDQLIADFYDTDLKPVQHARDLLSVPAHTAGYAREKARVLSDLAARRQRLCDDVLWTDEAREAALRRLDGAWQQSPYPTPAACERARDAIARRQLKRQAVSFWYTSALHALRTRQGKWQRQAADLVQSAKRGSVGGAVAQFRAARDRLLREPLSAESQAELRTLDIALDAAQAMDRHRIALAKRALARDNYRHMGSIDEHTTLDDLRERWRQLHHAAPEQVAEVLAADMAPMSTDQRMTLHNALIKPRWWQRSHAADATLLRLLVPSG